MATRPNAAQTPTSPSKDVVAILRALGSSRRLAIVNRMGADRRRGWTLKQLAEAMKFGKRGRPRKSSLNPGTILRHLRPLVQAGVVAAVRRGEDVKRPIIYSIQSVELLKWLKTIEGLAPRLKAAADERRDSAGVTGREEAERKPRPKVRKKRIR